MGTAYCDVCGKPATGMALIEGVKMRVCPKCASYGKPIFVPQPKPTGGMGSGGSGAAPLRAEVQEVFVVEGYSNLIRVARESKGLSISDLAKKLFINEGYLHQVEGGKRKPDEKIGRKLEAELGITLYSNTPQESGAKPTEMANHAGAGGFTLGDIVSVRKRK